MQTKNYIPPDQMALLFYHFATASLAKSIVFQGVSQTHFLQEEGRNKEYISACITGYYSLLHMAISLMYFCPLTVDICLRTYLYEKVKSNVDPTKDITHKQAHDFLKSNVCVNNLPQIVSQQFAIGRKIREYLNYAPRTKIQGGGAIFGSCEFSEEGFDRFLNKNEEVIRLGIKWGLNHSPTQENNLLRISLSDSIVGVSQFLHNDLGYLQWLSRESLQRARELHQKLSGLPLVIEKQDSKINGEIA